MELNDLREVFTYCLRANRPYQAVLRRGASLRFRETKDEGAGDTSFSIITRKKKRSSKEGLGEVSLKDLDSKRRGKVERKEAPEVLMGSLTQKN